MRRTIHLLKKGAPMKCLECGSVSPILRKNVVNLSRVPAVCYSQSDWDTIYADNKDYRRCIDPPDPDDRPRFPLPTERGFYWAEWRIAEEGTSKKEDATPMFNAEVVEVWIDEPEEPMKVTLFGVSKSQSLDCFVWRSAKLEQPKE